MTVLSLTCLLFHSSTVLKGSKLHELPFKHCRTFTASFTITENSIYKNKAVKQIHSKGTIMFYKVGNNTV